MKASNFDRIFAVLQIVALIAYGYFSKSPHAVWYTIGGLILVATGIRYNPTGHWAQYKFFGDRIRYFVDEGVFHVPWYLGFWYTEYNCRIRKTKLDPVKAITSDNVEVEVSNMTLVWRINNVFLFSEQEADNFEKLIDDTVDINVTREKINTHPAVEVVKMRLGTDDIQPPIGLEQWGVEVLKILAPERARPTDPSFMAALQLEATEKLEQAGQMVQAQFVTILMELFQKPITEGGRGMTHEEALNEARRIVHEAAPEVQERIVVEGAASDAATAFLAKFLGK